MKRSTAERLYDALLRLVPDDGGPTRREMRVVFRDAHRDPVIGGFLARLHL